MHGGARMDWEPDASDRLTLQGDYFQADLAGPALNPSLTPPYAANFYGENFKNGENVLGRWTHDFSASSQLTLQGYYDHEVSRDTETLDAEDIWDLDLQHRFALGDRQDIVWGAGFRYEMDQTHPSFALSFFPQDENNHIASAFVQDDLTVISDRLHLIFGSKFEQDADTGFEVQPSGRLLWTPSPEQTAWMAVSRAVTTPSRTDTDVVFNQSVIPPSPPPGSPVPVLVSLRGDPTFHSEEIIAYELGYRWEPNPKLSFDLATFYNVYHDLSIYTAGTPLNYRPNGASPTIGN